MVANSWVPITYESLEEKSVTGTVTHQHTNEWPQLRI